MKWSNIKWVYLREMRDQLRDRRTLFTIAVLPVLLYPLLGMGFLQVAQFSREHPTKVLVLGNDALPESPSLIVVDADDESNSGRFAEQFCRGTETRLLDLEVRNHGRDSGPLEARHAVESGQFDAVVFFPRDFAEKLNAFRFELKERTLGPVPADNPDVSVASTGVRESLNEDSLQLEVPQPEIFVNTASDKSRIARDRVERVLRTWRESIVRDNLELSKIPVAATRPFGLVNTDVARERSRRAAVWSKILPFVVLIWALTGAFYPAVDLCAGEKERGTLETLLCSPAQRGEIVFGKLLTIMTFSMATSLLNLVSMGLTGLFIITQLNRLEAGVEILMGPPPIGAMGWIVLALVPISALFSALSLAIAAFARSSKEGQYYLMPLLLITLPLMMLPMLPSAELDPGTSLIPVTGMMLLLKSLMEGQYLESLKYAVPVVGITGICCLLAIRWAIDQFNNESVLFRESERFALGLWLRHVVRDRRETPSLAEAILCGVVLLMVRFFASFLMPMPDGWSRFASMAVVTQLAFIAAPALLMTVILTRRPRKTLLLRMPSPAAIPMAVLLAIVIHPAGIALAEGVRWLYPFNQEMLEQLSGMSGILNQAPSIWALLAVLALTPAICEELAFRGFILSGLRHMGHKWAAILASAVFFGATHGILQQSLSACAIGVVIGYLAVQTGSLLPGILFHLVYNSLSLVMATKVSDWAVHYPAWKWLFVEDQGNVTYQLPVLLISGLLAAAALAWFRGLPAESSPEETLQDALGHQQAAQPVGRQSGALVSGKH